MAGDSDALAKETQVLVKRVAEIVSRQAGIQLGPKQANLIESRLAGRWTRLRLSGAKDYLAYLEANLESESAALLSLMTTHHSFFFREFNQFEFLLDHCLNSLIQRSRQRGDKIIRIWSAAASRGQEAYSLAMFMDFHLKQMAPELDFEIWGTDVDPESIAWASNGVYRSEDLRDLPEKYLGHHWIKGKGDVFGFSKIRPEIKRKCKFTTANLLSCESFLSDKKEFDIIFCRNVFIYFDNQQIFNCVNRFLVHLDTKGFLFLGASEALSTINADKASRSMPHDSKQSSPQWSRHSTSSQPSAQQFMAIERKGPSVYQKRTNSVGVLIVDDSKTVRQLLEKIISQDPQLKVLGSAERPSQVEDLINKLKPDVITLDIHMPEMNGVELLEKIFPKYKIPTLMISSISKEEGPFVLRALEVGAFDYVQKPELSQLMDVGNSIREKIKMAATSQPRAKTASKRKVKNQNIPLDQQSLIVIGASTGGTEAIRHVLECLPEKIPPILVVQHIPAGFSAAFANRLNDLLPFEVREAKDQDVLRENLILIAPGDFQMGIESRNGKMTVQIREAPHVNRHRPSVDYLFHSAAQLSERSIVAAILTGMGSDGAKGLKALRDKGARTIAQDEASSVVYGMPREAKKINAAEFICSLDDVGAKIMELVACHKPIPNVKKTG